MKTKFRIWRKTNAVWVVRDDVIELELHTKEPNKVEKYVRENIKSYFEYLQFFNIDHAVHTSEWWCNHILKYSPEDDEDDMKTLVSRAVPRRLRAS